MKNNLRTKIKKALTCDKGCSHKLDPDICFEHQGERVAKIIENELEKTDLKIWKGCHKWAKKMWKMGEFSRNKKRILTCWYDEDEVASSIHSYIQPGSEG
jgi:hypothetical protein